MFIEGIVHGCLVGLSFFWISGLIILRLAAKMKGADRNAKCPFTISTGKSSSKIQHVDFEREYSCKWLNHLIYLLINSKVNLASRLKSEVVKKFYLYNKICPYINVEDVNFTQSTLPSVSLVTCKRLGDSLLYTISIDCKESQAYLKFAIKILAKIFLLNLQITRICGDLLILFVNKPSPRLNITISHLPDLNLSISNRKETRKLQRISNLIHCLIQSLLVSHLILPNYQTIIFQSFFQNDCRDGIRKSHMFWCPFWKTNRSFFWIKVKRILIDPEDQFLDENWYYCVIQSSENNQSASSDPIQKDPSSSKNILCFDYSYQFPIFCDSYKAKEQTFTFYLFRKRRKNYSRKLLVFSAELPLDAISTGIYTPINICSEFDTHKKFILHVYYSDCTFDVSEWPILPPSHAASLSPPKPVILQEKEFLDGFDWSNLKFAFNKLSKERGSNENVAGSERQIDNFAVMEQRPSKIGDGQINSDAEVADHGRDRINSFDFIPRSISDTALTSLHSQKETKSFDFSLFNGKGIIEIGKHNLECTFEATIKKMIRIPCQIKHKQYYFSATNESIIIWRWSGGSRLLNAIFSPKQVEIRTTATIYFTLNLNYEKSKRHNDNLQIMFDLKDQFKVFSLLFAMQKSPLSIQFADIIQSMLFESLNGFFYCAQTFSDKKWSLFFIPSKGELLAVNLLRISGDSGDRKIQFKENENSQVSLDDFISSNQCKSFACKFIEWESVSISGKLLLCFQRSILVFHSPQLDTKLLFILPLQNYLWRPSDSGGPQRLSIHQDGKIYHFYGEFTKLASSLQLSV